MYISLVISLDYYRN